MSVTLIAHVQAPSACCDRPASCRKSSPSVSAPLTTWCRSVPAAAVRNTTCRTTRCRRCQIRAASIPDADERLDHFLWDEMKLPDLTGKTAIVTGANSGIGFACALGLASKGCQVIVATRNAQKGQEAAKGINEAVNFLDLVEFMELNTADFRSIEKFVEEFKASGRPLHILINNAGTMMPKDQQGEKTNEGFEVTMGTNYFGPMYLTQLLLDNLKQSAPARIVNLGSCSEYGGRVPWDDLKGEQRRESNFDAYGSTKVMLMMAAKALNERLKGTGVEAFSAHPGVTTTPLYEKSDRANKPWAFAVDVAQKLYGQSEERGASPILYAAASPEVTGRGGAFIGGPVGNVAWTGATNLDQFKEREASTTPAVQDPEECRRLYEATLKIIDEAAKQRVRA